MNENPVTLSQISFTAVTVVHSKLLPFFRKSTKMFSDIPFSIMFRGQCITSGMQWVNLSGKSWISFSVTHSARGPTIRTGLNTGSNENNKFTLYIHSKKNILKLNTQSP